MQTLIKNQWLFVVFIISKINYCETILNSAENGNLNPFNDLNSDVNNFVSDSDNSLKSKWIYGTEIQFDDYKHARIKRTLEEEDEYLTEDFNKHEKNNSSREEFASTNDTDCVGAKEFCNMTREEYVYMLNNYIYPQPYEWVLIGTHSVVFVIGLIGNALVCIAVYRNHSMRTVTNYFIVNLAAADFMVILFCLPPTVLWDVTETWFLGNSLCKILLYFQSVSVTVSVLTLTFISVDRWYAICFPLKFKSTTSRAKTAILIIWVFSLLFNRNPKDFDLLGGANAEGKRWDCMLHDNACCRQMSKMSYSGLPQIKAEQYSPELVVLTVVQTVPLRFELTYLQQCMATWSETSELTWHIIKLLFIYTIPLFFMTVAYYQIVKVLWRSNNVPGQAETMKLATAEQSQLRSRRKAAKMLVAVVLMFAICYFPVHLLSVLRYTHLLEQSDAITCLALLTHVLCYANSAINPLIYNFMSGKFRREYRRAFCCAPTGQPEPVSTLSRGTTSKYRRKNTQSISLPTMTQCRSTSTCRGTCRDTCDTHFIESSSKNGLLS